MPASFSWGGFDALSRKLERLKNPDASPLMETWERIIVEDNRKGVLAGTDKDDKPMPPLQYRNGAGASTKGRKGAAKGTVAVGAHNPGVNGNLTTAEYKKLTGPRLAPRGVNSRVITNLHTGSGRDPGNANRWFALGAWADVVSKKGVAFLPAHFAGDRRLRLPKYDLTGVRAWGQKQAREALRQWVEGLLKR